MAPSSAHARDVPQPTLNDGLASPTLASRSSTLVVPTSKPSSQSPFGLRRAHTANPPGMSDRNNRIATERSRKGKATSPLRFQTSAEALHQQSSKTSTKLPSRPEAAVTGARGDNHFTVANVGNNGKLYLRY